MSRNIKLLLIDGMNMIRRIHAAQQEVDKLFTSVLQSIQRGVRESSATHLLLVMDGAGPTWRHQLYPAYKQGRRPMPDELRVFLPRLQQELQQAGVPWVSQIGVEADDLIAAAVHRLSDRDLGIVILSTDKGFLPLLSEQVTVRDHFNHHDNSVEDVRQRFGVAPMLLRDFWSLAGDSSNHIPGISGIGNKTAAGLLNHYGSLHNILSEADQIDGRMGDQIRQQKEQAVLYRQLLEPQVETSLDLSLRSCRVAQGWGRGKA